MTHKATINPVLCDDVTSSQHDSVILILDSIHSLPPCLSILSASLNDAAEIVSFTGALDRDIDDSRRLVDATTKGVNQAIKIGSIKPLLVLAPFKAAQKLDHDWLKPSSLCLTALSGALHALYMPLQTREFASVPRQAERNIKVQRVEQFGWYSGQYYTVDHKKMLHVAWCLEEGRRVARDIGGSDPERMSAKNIVKYLQCELQSPVEMKTAPVDPNEYPSTAAVDRGSSEKHQGQIVHLEYDGSQGASEADLNVTNLYLIGKGITYDTGGHDLKVNGSMPSMHRDKCGAAAVAGFFKVLMLLKPKHLKVHGSLALVRNSIGENAYVSDEIITSRAGQRIRVNNTDAEGRMVMVDLLCEAKERALLVRNSRIITIATLTGHVIQTYGPEYTAVICNGPAKSLKEDFNYQKAGSLLGEMFEISTLRREDYEMHKVEDDSADLINTARPLAGKRSRGHQSPVAFMIVGSGMDAHLSNSEQPLAYSHMDIAGSEGPFPGIPTAVPILALASRFVITQELDWCNFEI